MLSQTAEYALRAVLHLAREGSEGPVRVDDIARALDVPRNYLSKILHVLARSGLLTSTRGPHGGFELASAPSELTLADVVEEFDALEEHRACLLSSNPCDERSPCPAHRRWTEVSETILDFFRNTTVSELAGLPEDAASEAPVT